MSKLKLITDTDVLSRHDILHRIEEFTNTIHLEGIDLGNYYEFLSRGKKIVKLSFRKSLQSQNIQLFLTIFEKIYQILGCPDEFHKYAISLSKT